jgi:hypothetical protein
MHGHAILAKQQIDAFEVLYVVTVTFCVMRGDEVSIK